MPSYPIVVCCQITARNPIETDERLDGKVKIKNEFQLNRLLAWKFSCFQFGDHVQHYYNWNGANGMSNVTIQN